MKNPFLALVTLAVAAGAAQFQLQSETWTNLSGGGDSVLSIYRYDDQGNRILKESRPAPDTSGPAMAAIRYAYDSLNRLSRVAVLESGDTLSIVDYRYASSGNLAAIRTLDSAGTLRFVDSMLYDSKNRLVENRRVTGGAVLQTHRFAYDAQNRLISDSLLERQGSSLVPAQLILSAYDSAGLPSVESHFRHVNGQWYPIKTVKKGYVSRKLSFLVSYERDGSGNFLDSTAYAYDADGNRVLEKAFDDERQPMYSIAFAWRRVGPGSIRLADARRGGIQIRAGMNGLSLAAQGRGPLTLTLRTVRGDLLRKETVVLDAGQGAMAWPASLAEGVYLIEAEQGHQRRAQAVRRP